MPGKDDARPAVTPLVSFVAERIVETYLGATRAVSDRLPPERAIAETLGYSRGTVRLALRALADEGQVTNVPRSGWHANPTAYPAPRGPLFSFTQVAAMRRAPLESRLLKAAARLALHHEAQILELPAASRVFEVHRARILAGQTACVEHNIVALSHAPGIERAFRSDTSLYEVLERHGARPQRSELTAEAALAGADAAHLGIEPTAPVFVEHEVVSGEFGRPLMLARGVWRADRYKFRATFTA